MPHHIAVQLDFLSYLAFKAAFALHEGQEEHARIASEAHDRFIEQHLATWLAAFRAKLEHSGSAFFIRAAAAVQLPKSKGKENRRNPLPVLASLLLLCLLAAPAWAQTSPAQPAEKPAAAAPAPARALKLGAATFSGSLRGRMENWGWFEVPGAEDAYTFGAFNLRLALEQKKERLEKEEKAETKRKKTLEHELEWIRMSPKARQSKGKARLNRYEELVNQKQESRAEELEIYIPPGPRLGDVVVEARGISKAFGDKVLYENLSFDLPKGGIVGVIGPNGAGKTTLFKMIVGKEKPDSGTIRIGETVKLGYVDQDRSLDGNKTVYEVISDGQDTIKLGKVEVNARGYCARFNFAGTDQQKKVKDLSGGERNRVHLARMLKEGANLILLDEPTNDLDVNTLRALEEGLENFAGCAVISSHDRWFLDRIATHILAFEGDSKVVWFEGNYSDYEADRKRRLGKEAEQPHRIRYRKLTRS